MKVLVTGGAGFIGSHVSSHLAWRGHEVHVLDRFSYAGRLKNLKEMVGGAGCRIWCGDLKEWDVCTKLAEFGFDWLIHMASNTHIDHSIRNPHVFVQDNVVGTDQLLHAFSIHRLPPRTLVYSTDEVFGPTPPGERFDESAPMKPSNPYSASKVAIEALCHSYGITFGYQPMIVRPCNTYGPNQHPEKVIPRFVRQALAGEPLTVHNDGSGARDWLFVRDHARATEAIMLRGQLGHSYNLAAGDEHTDIEIATEIQDILKVTHNIKNVNIRPGHDKRYWMDNSKLRLLDWKPETPFNIGFRDTVMWNKNNIHHWADDSLNITDVA